MKACFQDGREAAALMVATPCPCIRAGPAHDGPGLPVHQSGPGLHHGHRFPVQGRALMMATPCIMPAACHGLPVHPCRPGGMEAGSGEAWPRRASWPPPAMPARLMGPPRASGHAPRRDGSGQGCIRPRPDARGGWKRARVHPSTACHACPSHGVIYAIYYSFFRLLTTF